MTDNRDIRPDIPTIIPRSFASRGDNNAPGRCLWCGEKLRAAPSYRRPCRRGDYADNAFCGLRCGYAFGLRMAQLGRRLIEKKETAS